MTTGTLVLVLVTLAALGVGLMGRGRDARWLQSQLAVEREHRLILDSADQGVLGLDRNGRHVFVNRAACRMLGYEPGELLDKPSHAVWHFRKADGEPYSLEECPALATLRTGNSCRSDEEVFWRKDGTSFPAEYIATPSLEKDRPVAVILFFRDITERKKIEEEQKQLVAIIEATPDFVGYADARDKHIIYLNKAGRKMCGIGSDEDVTKLKIYDVHPEWTNRMFAEEILPAAVRDGTWTGECAFLNIRDGREIPVSMVLCSRKATNGEVEVFFTVSRDITDRKRAEEELRRSNEEVKQYTVVLESSNQTLKEFYQIAESATRAKSEFLANMSHEIRTPMTAILGYVDLLLTEEGLEQAPPHRREAFETIKRNGEHLLGLINDILDLSKVESGKMEIHRVRCSPLALLAEVVSLMRVRAAEKSLSLEAEAVGPLPETVLTDPLRLRQILVNLVGNAVKFTDQGEVRVAMRLVCDGGPQRLRFDVTDTGIGMNEEQVARLFQPFSQVDNSATRKFGGTGLGLAISQRLAEILGGAIEVRSVAGKGSTFSVTIDPGPLDGIPLVRQTEANIEPFSPTATPVAGSAIELHARVLLAEDGPDNQRLISHVLRKAGADVVAVENGQLAVEAALARSEAGCPFDVILMDMQMPVMDGYAATRSLRQHGYAGPIVALTAHAMAEDRQACLDAGCDDYATKPINRQRLLATVALWAAKATSDRDGGTVTDSVARASSP